VVIPQINIDFIILRLYFQRKQCDVINGVITQYIYSRQTWAVTDAHLHSRGDRSPVVNTREDSRGDLRGEIASSKRYIRLTITACQITQSEVSK